MNLRIWAAGCSLIDYLYTPVDFAAAPFARYGSRRDGDGGVKPGRLVFAEDLERFAGLPFARVLEDLTGGAEPARVNLGGPAVVAAINAAQLLEGRSVSVHFQGARGSDRTGERIMEVLSRTPVDFSSYRLFPGATPFTYVFSDPSFAGGRGERMFVNAIGAAGRFEPSQVDERLFGADVALLGATAIVPPLHRALGSLLRRVRERGGITVVSTVFDFLNEQADPDGRWPLGESDETFGLIDLLVTDREEALRTSGTRSVAEAVDFFREMGTGTVVVTQGAEPFWLWSRGTLFAARDVETLPVCGEVDRAMDADPDLRGDTTGCGDNFVGGLLASLAAQLAAGARRGDLDLTEACAWAAASGGFACTYVGGTYLEKAPGEKRARIEPYYRAYLSQIGRRGQAGLL